MNALRWSAAALLTLTTVSCMDLSPDRRVMAVLGQFQVPDSIGAADSLHVSFSAFYGSCDTHVSPEVLAFTGLRSFAVWVRQGNCPDGTGAIQLFQYAFPPSQRANPFTLQFRLSGGDTVLTVIWR